MPNVEKIIWQATGVQKEGVDIPIFENSLGNNHLGKNVGHD